MVLSSVSVRVGVLSFGPHSILRLKLLPNLYPHPSTIRQQTPPPKPWSIKYAPPRVLPHRQLMVPRPSLPSHSHIRLHRPVIDRAHHHQVVRRIQKLRPTHPPILTMMHHQLIRPPTMPTVIVPHKNQFPQFHRDSHTPIVQMGAPNLYKTTDPSPLGHIK